MPKANKSLLTKYGSMLVRQGKLQFIMRFGRSEDPLYMQNIYFLALLPRDPPGANRNGNYLLHQRWPAVCLLRSRYKPKHEMGGILRKPLELIYLEQDLNVFSATGFQPE